MNLLYYQPRHFGRSYQSEARSPDFFLSPAGKDSPEKELDATIDALFAPAALNDAHALCRFPARTDWLVHELDIPRDALPEPDCDRLEEWRSQLGDVTVSVVMPAAYLNNPSSMFGHAFLRLDSNLPRAQGLLSFTLGFAADTSSYKGAVDYVYRGLFGGFPCDDSLTRYYRMVRQYSDIERRDLWEYTLKLSDAERERLLSHLWEVRDKKVFDYYFLEENCAYRILGVIDAAVPGLNLKNEFSFYVIPADAMRALRDHGLILATSYRPSAQKAFTSHVELLDADTQKWVISAVERQSLLNDQLLKALPPGREHEGISATAEYLSMLIDRDQVDRKEGADLEKWLLVQRCNFSPPDKHPQPNSPPSPDSGHRGHRLSVGGGVASEGGYGSLAYRQLYHDLSDPARGYEKGQQISILDAEVRYYQGGRIALDSAVLIDVANFSPVNRFFLPLSWRYAVGREERNIDEVRRYTYVEGEWGPSFGWGPFIFPALLRLSAENSSQYGGKFGAMTGFKLGAISQGDRVSATIMVEANKVFNAALDAYVKGSVTAAYALSGNSSIALALSATGHADTIHYDNNISLRLYF